MLVALRPPPVGRRSRRLSSLAVALLGLSACGGGSSSAPPSNGCQKSSDCATGFYCNSKSFCQLSLGCSADAQCQAPLHCDVQTGECLCSADSDCKTGQICNSTGHCQSPAACFYDSDCATNFICDTASHACIAQGSCAADIQCPIGQVCSHSASGGGSCVAGCVQDGDCPLADITGPGQVHYAQQACLNGVCSPGGCNFTSSCPFGQSCNQNQCQSACSQATPYCQSCDPTQQNACSGANSLCMVDSRNASSCSGPGAGCLFFCGIDCTNTPCPSGYSCQDVIFLQPGNGGGPDTACNCGQSCADGTPCLCQEGATSGFCPCHVASDCPQNGCTLGACQLSGSSCNSNADCNSPTCTQGNCVSAKTCGPDKQFNCPPGSGPCQGG